MITGNEPINQVKYGNGSQIGAKDANLKGWMEATEPFFGLTIRQHFAAMAMQGLISKYNLSNPEDQKIVSQMAVELAESLIAELNKQ